MALRALRLLNGDSSIERHVSYSSTDNYSNYSIADNYPNIKQLLVCAMNLFDKTTGEVPKKLVKDVLYDHLYNNLEK